MPPFSLAEKNVSRICHESEVIYKICATLELRFLMFDRENQVSAEQLTCDIHEDVTIRLFIYLHFHFIFYFAKKNMMRLE